MLARSHNQILWQLLRKTGQLRDFQRASYFPHVPHIPENWLRESEEISIVNPATSRELCTVVSASPQVVRKAINDAQKAFQSGVWSRSSTSHRSNVLTSLAGLLEQRTSDLARMETLQTGRTIREMNAQLSRLPEWLHYYAALLRTNEAFVAPTQGKLLNYVQRVPLGVVAQITPFNHPLLISVKKLAPALAAGNSVVVKPSELAPVTVLELAAMAQQAGVPPGVLSVLPGYGATTGRDVVSHPLIRKVDVTASTQTGRDLGRIAGFNLAAYTAELGGKAPVIVFDDADLRSAVNGAAFASFVASGQTCVSGSRILVQDGIYDNFVAMFIEKTESVCKRIGDPLNPMSAMGTVISLRHLERVAGMINNRKSGRLLTGGERMMGRSTLDGFDLSRGFFFTPTVIEEVNTADILWREEIFGPVVVIKRFSTEREGIALANDSKYGLGAGIWTSDLSRAHRVASEMEVGLCWVNTHHRNDPSSPWGGMKESGIGRENGLEALESYSQSKSTIINIATAEEMQKQEDWFAERGSARYG